MTTSDAIMREHCYHGYQMLRKIPFPTEACDIVYSHQEHFDGTGYPRGLKGNEIPLGARKEIQAWSGRQFDPEVVEVFQKMPDELFEDLRREINAQSCPFSYAATKGS
jgi:HD-GYP domain-containing protein (c-di-GMP phosphodiesterase class II)